MEKFDQLDFLFEYAQCLLKSEQYAEAEQCFLKAANIVPNRIYSWYLLTKLYVEMGETEKAQETARIVLTKEPKVQSTAVREMREKMKEIIQDSKIQ
ncbi:MAG: tetratricopeptide repeat protein [Tannerella sp.]|nr:tetratricopeptide repeat protein [Tannerella sp.]